MLKPCCIYSVRVRVHRGQFRHDDSAPALAPLQHGARGYCTKAQQDHGELINEPLSQFKEESVIT